MTKVKISARAEAGFFRCGVFFPKAGKVVAADAFDEDQWKRIASEPNLIVEPAGEDEPGTIDEAIAEIVAAISTLPADAFTQAGPPKVGAVREALGDKTVTAEQVAAAWDQVKAMAEASGTE